MRAKFPAWCYSRDPQAIFGHSLLEQSVGFTERKGDDTSPQSQNNRWLSENGPKELEQLFRAIVFYPSAPILLTDDNRQHREVSVGASKLLDRKSVVEG